MKVSTPFMVFDKQLTFIWEISSLFPIFSFMMVLSLLLLDFFSAVLFCLFQKQARWCLRQMFELNFLWHQQLTTFFLDLVFISFITKKIEPPNDGALGIHFGGFYQINKIMERKTLSFDPEVLHPWKWPNEFVEFYSLTVL